MKHNPDDRRDNVERIQFNIDHTIKNIVLLLLHNVRR